MVSDRRLCDAFDAIDRARGETPLTYFEFGTLAALDIFTDAGLDLMILEVGLGGRLDAVNIIDADLALITTVDYDHMAWLGESREAIGAEKSGILRRGRPLVLGDAQMPDSVMRRADELDLEVFQYDRDFRAEQKSAGWNWLGPGVEYPGLPDPGHGGIWQYRNAASAIMACQCLIERLPVMLKDIVLGLTRIRLQGRLQIIEGSPPMVLDVAHNRQAVGNLRRSLERMEICGRIIAICGFLADKDITPIVDIMEPIVEHWFLVGTEGPRGQTAEALKSEMRRQTSGHSLMLSANVSEAMDSARSIAEDDDVILIFGSFQVVGAALTALS
jgi:dihydrofolate synthase/folylpolyglutamate synthase